MRYDQKIYFIKETKDYNVSTGDYDTSNIKYERIASVMDLGAEKMQLIFGKVVQGALAISIKTPIYEDFNCIEYKGELYEVKLSRTLRQEQSFIVEKRQ